MPNIKKLVVGYLRKMTLFIVLILLIVSVLFQILTEQSKARDRSEEIFTQVEQILEENQHELTEIKEEYSRSCLNNAETIAYFIQQNPELIGNIEELKKLAYMTEVDEIHIFDKTGRIFSGTHPEYYDFTFDSGEQIGYFKPMLEDKSLKLCQEIVPNTAENKMMQYSALWSDNGEFIVQIGMEPLNVMKVTEKNQLSYIFSLLRADSGVELYAINKENEEIIGSTKAADVGKKISDIGFDMEIFKNKPNGFHTGVSGVDSYCIFTETDGNIIMRAVSNDTLYKNIPLRIIELAACIATIAIILAITASRYMNKFVINGIYDVNDKLRLIAEGNLDEKVDVHSSLEFSELSNHINDMIKSLLLSTDKMSYVLNKTNLNIGVYEYNENMKNVRFTEYVPKVLALDTEKSKTLSSDYRLFREFMSKLRDNPVPEEADIFRLDADTEHYVKLDEISRGNDILGIVMDVTSHVKKRREIEAERDIDALTGLYNRGGLERKLSALFGAPEKLRHGALIMIDADGLKLINDKYGHEKGDIYLKKISEVISSFGRNSGICSRLGGDEFVVFLYNYSTEKELLDTIDTLTYIQNNSTAYLSSDLSVPLRFSFGYCLTKGQTDYTELLKQADKKMYESKIERKKQLV